jgi:regulatory protein RepA
MPPTVSKSFHFMDIPSCLTTEPLPLDFVLPGFPTGTVGGLASPGGVGKSTFILSVAVAIGIPGADANLLGFRLEKHGRVVVLAGEDPANTLYHRMHALGAYLSPAQHSLLSENLHIASCVGMGVDIHDSEWFAQIDNLAKNTRLMVIDTLTRLHSLDENNAGDAKKLCLRWKVLLLAQVVPSYFCIT